MIALAAALLFAGLVHGAEPAVLPEPPEAPERRPDQPGDCPVMAAAPAGAARDCAAVSVPPEYLAYLEATRVHAERLELHLTAARSAAAMDAAHAADALAWRDDVIADLRTPVPVLQRPGVQVALGVSAGMALTVGAGWALGQVAP